MLDALEMNFEKLLQYFQSISYGSVVLAITETLVIILSIRFTRNNKLVLIFLIYVFVDLILVISHWFMMMSDQYPPTARKIFLAYGNTITTFLELGAYYFYFIKLLGNDFKSILKKLFFLYVVLMLIYLFTKFNFITGRIDYVSNLMSVVEFIILLPPCFYYYYHLLNTNSPYKVFQRPSFWIVTGILLFALLSIPHYLINSYFNTIQTELPFKRMILLFYYLPFTLNILFLFKAFLCKKDLTI
jgi:hypothetical protein